MREAGQAGTPPKGVSDARTIGRRHRLKIFFCIPTSTTNTITITTNRKNTEGVPLAYVPLRDLKQAPAPDDKKKASTQRKKKKKTPPTNDFLTSNHQRHPPTQPKNTTNLEVAESTGSLGVDNTLGDPLAVKVCQVVDQGVVLTGESERVCEM